MARSFHQSLLAAVVAVVVGGSALAQDNLLQEAVTMLRVATTQEQKDAAVAKLQEIIASDPSNEDALRLYQSVSQDEWYMLMGSQGEIQKIAQSILERAKVTRRDRIRDEDTIRGLVDQACMADADYPTRQGAINKLIQDHGEFAVPALIEKLGMDDADAQVNAIAVLYQLQSSAVLPLIEALNCGNDIVVRNVAAALKMIGDDRAAPSMARLANDSRNDVQSIAKKFLEQNKVTGDAMSLAMAQVDRYLVGNIPPGGYSDVVWSLVDDKLVATDVPAKLYPTELAKSVAAHAVAMQPSSLQARSALAQANLAQSEIIDMAVAQGDEALAGMASISGELKVAALATGVDALRSALEAGVRKGLAPVAVGAIHALADAELVDSVGDSSLVAALQSTDKRIRYAAAEAVVQASRGAAVPQLDSVVKVLAQAVTEERVHTVRVIAPPSNEVSSAVASVANVPKIAAEASDSALDGMRKLLNCPVDVVVINEVLPDRLPEDVIGNIRKDSRAGNTRIVIVAKDEDAAREHFGDEVTYVAAPLTSENLQAAVKAALEGVSDPAGARLDAYARQASNALLDLARRKVDIGAAIGNLSAQLNNTDDVAVPAAKALGLSGGANELPGLLTALETGSDEMKKASAEAIGNILGRMDSCPDDVVMGLSKAMEASSDADLRKALAIAFGKAKIDAGKKAELLRKLSRIAGSVSEG